MACVVKWDQIFYNGSWILTCACAEEICRNGSISKNHQLINLNKCGKLHACIWNSTILALSRLAINTGSTEEDASRHDWKMLSGMYIIKSNVPLAQLQRNLAGECLHKSLAAGQESLSFGVLTWSDINMPVCWSSSYVAWVSEWVCV